MRAEIHLQRTDEERYSLGKTLKSLVFSMQMAMDTAHIKMGWGKQGEDTSSTIHVCFLI